VDIGLDLVNIFLSKTTKKLGLFYQKLVYLSMFFVGFIVINQVVGWFLRVDINWTVFDDAFEQHYSQDNGRPSKPIRLMAGLLILKQLENLSDERVV
jgi:IS5 family transposase